MCLPERCFSLKNRERTGFATKAQRSQGHCRKRRREGIERNFDTNERRCAGRVDGRPWRTDVDDSATNIA